MESALALSLVTVGRISAGVDDFVSSDVLAVEEPLEIRIGLNVNGKIEHKAVSITMRTPGDDHSLAAGFLFTEGIVRSREQITRIRSCGIPAKANQAQNTVVVELAAGTEVDLKRLERNFYTTSSCGVCGKSSIEALHTGVQTVADSDIRVNRDLIQQLPSSLLAAQDIFQTTGGLHASVLFDLDGRVDVVAEDVGRHNALDKVIGMKFLSGATPLSESILMVSGRASFELVQKALMAGIPVLAAIGAPSSLAVELAAEFGMTLLGFVRADRFNVYAGGDRII